MILGILENVFCGLPLLLSWKVLFYAVVGTGIGVAFGMLPGLGALVGVAITIPLTYSMDMVTALSLLLTIYCGAIYGGSISATLIGVPGTSAAIMTMLDAYPLGQQGRAGEALFTATIFSFIGGMISVPFLMVLAPLIAGWALGFSSFEYFSVAVLGICVITLLGEGSITKGLISGLFGLLLATVGFDAISAYPRFTFGIGGLYSGLDFVIVSLGLFGIAQTIQFYVDKMGDETTVIRNVKKIAIPFKTFLRLLKVVPRQVLLGVGIGALPGTGPTIASILAYGIEKKVSKEPEEFGKGKLEGIAGPETANNAATGGALIPLISLGIPGDATTAVLLGAFLLHGITPGPLAFQQQPQIMSALYLLLFVANICFLVFGLLGAKIFPKILGIPQNILMVLVAVLCFIGAFSIRNSFFDIIMTLFFGLIGYFMIKGSIPRAPLILGLILGPIMEKNFQRSMVISDGNFLAFFHRPVSGVVLGFSILILLLPICMPFIKKLFKRNVKEV